MTLALAGTPPSDCSSFDVDGNDAVTIDELLRAVDALLFHCQ